ncbi:MAG: serine/threonine protein kinase [Opitutus sp.]|nr:serine/threonine protein kinase [Opitutus sp.]
MKSPTFFPLGLALVLLGVASRSPAANWPAWRGPLGTGITEEKNLPVKWSATENVKWRVPLPEPGNSTPIVWGDRLFLTQSIGAQRTLLCLNRADGRTLWHQDVTTKPGAGPTHQTNPYCASSPVTDGERVIVWHGSDGLHCYTLTGEKLWSRDLGVQRHIWGYGASPIISGDGCFLNFGPGERNFLVAVDKRTGRTLWQHDEDIGYGEISPSPEPKSTKAAANATYVGSWTTPVIKQIDGRDQLLLSWPRRLAAYDPATGAELWTCAGLNPLAYTSPIYEGETVVAMGGFNGSTIAVRAGGRGDITASRRLWQHPRTKQRVGSGVIRDGYIFVHNDPGVAECFELATGKLVWEERLTSAGQTRQNWSSVLLSGDLCYTITQGGDGFIFKASPKFELVAVNPLGEPSNSSIVPSNGELFIRTAAALWCIAARR